MKISGLVIGLTVIVIKKSFMSICCTKGPILKDLRSIIGHKTNSISVSLIKNKNYVVLQCVFNIVSFCTSAVEKRKT